MFYLSFSSGSKDGARSPSYSYVSAPGVARWLTLLPGTICSFFVFHPLNAKIRRNYFSHCVMQFSLSVHWAVESTRSHYLPRHDAGMLAANLGAHLWRDGDVPEV